MTYDLSVDHSGPCPALVLSRQGQATVTLNSRRDPVQEADRFLTATLRGEDPPLVVLIGLGLGYVLDALERRGSAARVLAFEPMPEAIPHFRDRRDWSSWVDGGRLQIVEGPEYDNASEAWRSFNATAVPPVLVSPGLGRSCPQMVAAARGALTGARYGSPLDPRAPVVSQSMLHAEVLTFLEHAAATAHGAVVEIGGYVGGATMAMTRGIRDSGRPTPMVTIEPGVAHLTHPSLPSADTFGDLTANLRARGLDDYVTVMKGFSTDPAVLDHVRAMLHERRMRIGLLCIDADGLVQRDFDSYLPMCGDGCVIVVDDYSGPPENIKAEPTQTAVHALLARGQAREVGVYGWGTWVGVYTPTAADRT